MLTRIFLIITNSTKFYFNKALQTKNSLIVEIYYQKYLELMRYQFALYAIMIILIHFFGLYYCFLFCSIYIKSVNGWIQGVAMNFLIDFCISGFIIPLSVSVFREITLRFKSRLKKRELN